MRRDRVLVVDADPQLQRLLRARLQDGHYEVRVIERGEDASQAAAEYEPDMILLDLDLPGIDGVETTRRLREWSQAPIIALDGRKPEQRKVEVLDTGADDYLDKPLDIAELLARMRAVLRRARNGNAATSPAAPLTFRNLTMDLVSRRVFLDGQPLHLTPKEYELLRVLVTQAGRVVTHRELLIAVWGLHSASDTQYLHVFIGQLRRKLERRRGAPRHILTEAGVGYCFIDKE